MFASKSTEIDVLLYMNSFDFVAIKFAKGNYDNMRISNKIKSQVRIIVILQRISLP